MLRVPELNAVLHMGSPESRVEGENYLPGPSGHAAFDPALHVVGFFSFLTALEDRCRVDFLYNRLL